MGFFRLWIADHALGVSEMHRTLGVPIKVKDRPFKFSMLVNFMRFCYDLRQ